MLIQYLPIVITLMGFVLSFISTKRSSKLIRGVEICEDAIIEQIKAQLSSMADHFKNEINRILALSLRNLEIDEIDNMGLEDFDTKITNKSLRFFKKAFRHIRILEFTHTRIKIYRTIVFIIFIFALIKILKPNLISIPLLNVLLIVSIMFILLFSFDMIIYTDSLIDRIRKEYGIKI